MAESKSIDQNVDDFLKIVAELGILQVEVSDEVQAILLLTSLPTNFDQLKHTLKCGRESMSLEEVVSAARSREREVTELKSERDSGSALYTNERGRSSSRSYKDSKNGKGRGRSNSKSRVTCWFCKKEGHIKKDCYVRKRSESDVQGEAWVITEKLVFIEPLNVDHQVAKSQWVIDSGCTFHMTSHKKWLFDFCEKDPMMILLGDDHTIESKGYGTVRVNTNGGTIKVLKNVRYVPNLRRNLISTETLDKLGYSHQGGDGTLSFFKNEKLALRGI